MATINERADRVVGQAKTLARRAKSWTEFSNQVFSQEESLVAKAFPRMTERRAFFELPQYEQLNGILLDLIKRFGFADGAAPKKSGKFVLRLPKSLHASLEVEAQEEGVSLNQLATAKLAVRLKDATDFPRTTPGKFVGKSTIARTVEPLTKKYEPMKSYEFRLILAEVDEVSDAQAEALYQAGCDDGTICSSEGVASIVFSRQASSLEEAINSAVANIASTGLRAVRVEAECPV